MPDARAVAAMERLDTDARAVLAILPFEDPGISTGSLAERAFGMNLLKYRRRVRECLDHATWEWGIRIRRFGPRYAMQVRIEPEDRQKRDAVLAEGVKNEQTA